MKIRGIYIQLGWRLVCIRFLYTILFIVLYLYYDYTKHPFFARLVESITPWERSSGSIGHKDLSRKRKIIQMSGGGKGFFIDGFNEE